VRWHNRGSRCCRPPRPSPRTHARPTDSPLIVHTQGTRSNRHAPPRGTSSHPRATPDRARGPGTPDDRGMPPTRRDARASRSRPAPRRRPTRRLASRAAASAAVGAAGRRADKGRARDRRGVSARLTIGGHPPPRPAHALDARLEHEAREAIEYRQQDLVGQRRPVRHYCNLGIAANDVHRIAAVAHAVLNDSGRFHRRQGTRTRVILSAERRRRRQNDRPSRLSFLTTGRPFAPVARMRRRRPR
jgi:hypothetical protein